MMILKLMDFSHPQYSPDLAPCDCWCTNLKVPKVEGGIEKFFAIDSIVNKKVFHERNGEVDDANSISASQEKNLTKLYGSLKIFLV